MRCSRLFGCVWMFIGACAETTPATSSGEAAGTDSGAESAGLDPAIDSSGGGPHGGAGTGGGGATSVEGGITSAGGGRADASSNGLGDGAGTADAGGARDAGGIADAASSVLFRINGGGPAVPPFSADQYYSGGSSFSLSNAVDTTRVTGPAPVTVYQTERFGNFVYTFPGLMMGAPYTVRLHFAEIWFTTPNKRLFNVAINGAQVLSAFDIYATAGANTALIEELKVNADAAGQIAIQFSTIREDAKVSAIEVLGP